MLHRLRGYSASRTVFLDEAELSPERSQQVKNHSPTGFAWGYLGSGPAQLALAIMLELYPERIALEKYQQFKVETVSVLPAHEDFNVEFET